MIGAFAFLWAIVGWGWMFIQWAKKGTDWSKTFSRQKTVSSIDEPVYIPGAMDYDEFCQKYKAGSPEEDEEIKQWFRTKEGYRWLLDFRKQWKHYLPTELLIMAIYALHGKIYYKVIDGIYLRPSDTIFETYRDFLLWFNDELKAHGIEEMYYLDRHRCVVTGPTGGYMVEHGSPRMDVHFHNAKLWNESSAPCHLEDSDGMIFWPSCAAHSRLNAGRYCD